MSVANMSKNSDSQVEEESEPVPYVSIHETSSEVLHPSKKTLHFRLRKKEAENDILTAELIVKKQDFKEKMKKLALCRKKLYQKYQNNKTQADGFEKYLKECNLKTERALEKHKCEQQNNVLKREEIHTLKIELQTLKNRQHELQKQLAKYKSYEHFLKEIVNMLPPEFWGYQEDLVITTLTQRYKTLSSANQDLKKHLLTQEENIEKIHHEYDATQEEHNTIRFVMLPEHVLIGKVSELQSKYDILKERNIRMIDYIDNKESLTSHCTRELSRMLSGISNMAELCYRKQFGPLKQMTFQSKLDMIQVGKSEFICEKTEIKTEVMKPEAYSDPSGLSKR